MVVFPPKPFLGLENKSVWETYICVFVWLVGWFYLCFFLGGLAERPPSPGSLPALPLPSSTLQAASSLPGPSLAVALLVFQDLPCVLPAPTLFMEKSHFPLRLAEPWGAPSGPFCAPYLPRAQSLVEIQDSWEQISKTGPLGVWLDFTDLRP